MVHTDEITLALGPTNTGKTHRAVERLLEHDSGIVGLPLRLLAREVYDRVTARVGEREVALVTGEEKRIPPRPRYWICTVEAMPAVPVDFVAVDEIQLAAHRERGHVFSDRLLHTRGRRETWFLGADTMAPLARRLLPGAELRRQPRLSTLRHAGGKGLGGLPPKSAVIAFSADEVYALAGRLRARRGGAAVVLGALSPRTRNAQVALYQAGEVSYLVATDAVGMGLNLDVDHVAFASRIKFDGRERRPLDSAELAQIAGRAGRNRQDGTFGTLNPLPAFSDRTVLDIEEHRFAPVRRLVWRNSSLDFTSIDALVRALAAPPPSELYSRVEQADDFDALRALGQREEVLARAANPSAVELLWAVCQVPDYRKLLLLRHVGLLAELFCQLVDRGRLDPEFVDAHVQRIDRVDGEVDQLTARLAAIRVWTNISHHADWLDDAVGWQERTRAIEDRLGDALHERLVARFVEPKRKRVSASAKAKPAGPFAQLGELLEERRDEDEELRAAWIERLIASSHEQLAVDEVGRVMFEGARVGRLGPGKDRTAPTVRATVEELGAGARSRVQRRLVAFVKDWVAELLAPLALTAEDPSAVRGLVYQLEQGLGAVSRRDAQNQLSALGHEERARLDAMGVVVGRRAVYAAGLYDASSLQRRATLVGVHRGAHVDPLAERARDVTFEEFLAMGYLPLGPRAVRVDLVERALAALPSPELALDELLGVPEGALGAVMAALGYRLREGAWERTKRRRRRRPRS